MRPLWDAAAWLLALLAVMAGLAGWYAVVEGRTAAALGAALTVFAVLAAGLPPPRRVRARSRHGWWRSRRRTRVYLVRDHGEPTAVLVQAGTEIARTSVGHALDLMETGIVAVTIHPDLDAIPPRLRAGATPVPYFIGGRGDTVYATSPAPAETADDGSVWFGDVSHRHRVLILPPECDGWQQWQLVAGRPGGFRRLLASLAGHLVGEVPELVRSWAGLVTVVAVAAMLAATIAAIVVMLGATGTAGSGWLVQVRAAADALLAVPGAPVVLAMLPIAVIAVGLLNGPRAMLGAGGAIASTTIVCAFAIPSLQAGMPGWIVGLAGGSACAVLALWLTYGPIAVSCAAMLAVGAAIAVTTAIGALVFSHVPLGGGIALAVTLIWACGALADNAVCQASAVRELRAAAPRLGHRELASRALRLGEDHQGSMLHTMGPTLLPELVHALAVFGNATPDGAAVALALTRLALVTIALALATSITTHFAVWLICRLPKLPAAGHEHDHDHDH